MKFLALILLVIGCSNTTSKGESVKSFSDMETMIKLTSHLLLDGGNWYGMKSKNSKDVEMTTIKYSYNVDKIDVPHLKAERYLITVVNTATNKL